MPVFQYTAIDQQGKPSSGLLHGASMDTVAQRLSQDGLTVQSLSIAQGAGDPLAASGGEQARAGWTPFGGPKELRPLSEKSFEERSRFQTDVAGPVVGSVPLEALHFFFRQLGTMLHAGISPVQAFEALGRQTSNNKLREVIASTRDHVTSGKKISEGFERYPEVFSPLIMNMLKVGEQGGVLSDQCFMIADYLERDIELRTVIRRETFYPKMVFAFSIILVLGVNAFIKSINPTAQRLPALVGAWVAVGVAVAVWFLFRRYGMKNEGVRRYWDGFVISMPWVGNMVHGFAMAKFGRAFGALYQSGIPLGRATVLAADSCGNMSVQRRVLGLAGQLEAGHGVTETFERSGAFTPVVLEMVRTGETTGHLNEMLTKVSVYYEQEGQVKARQGAMILGLIAFVLVAVYVGYMLISFYSGYFGGRIADLNSV